MANLHIPKNQKKIKKDKLKELKNKSKVTNEELKDLLIMVLEKLEEVNK